MKRKNNIVINLRFRTFYITADDIIIVKEKADAYE